MCLPGGTSDQRSGCPKWYQTWLLDVATGGTSDQSSTKLGNEMSLPGSGVREYLTKGQSAK